MNNSQNILSAEDKCKKYEKAMYMMATQMKMYQMISNRISCESLCGEKTGVCNRECATNIVNYYKKAAGIDK